VKCGQYLKLLSERCRKRKAKGNHPKKAWRPGQREDKLSGQPVYTRTSIHQKTTRKTKKGTHLTLVQMLLEETLELLRE